MRMEISQIRSVIWVSAGERRWPVPGRLMVGLFFGVIDEADRMFASQLSSNKIVYATPYLAWSPPCSLRGLVQSKAIDHVIVLFDPTWPDRKHVSPGCVDGSM